MNTRAPLRTVTRLSAAGFALCLIAGAAFAVFGDSASARTQERITMAAGDAKEIVYPALIGNSAVGQLDASTAYSPELCGTPAATYCDMIPLTFDAPPNDDDYFVSIELSWQTQEIHGSKTLGETAVNDVDMFMTNDPIVPDAGPDQDGFVYAGASSSQPERIVMYKPAGNFLLYVGNLTGVNTGYTLKLSWITDVLTSPFEALPPSFTQTGLVVPKSTGTSKSTPVAALPSGGTLDLPSVGVPDLAQPGLAAPDASFDSGFSDAKPLDDVIAGPDIQVQRTVATVKADPPSGASLLLWLIALPLGLVALGGAFLQRRSKHMLSF